MNVIIKERNRLKSMARNSHDPVLHEAARQLAQAAKIALRKDKIEDSRKTFEDCKDTRQMWGTAKRELGKYRDKGPTAILDSKGDLTSNP